MNDNCCPITLEPILPENLLTITTGDVVHSFDIKAFAQYLKTSHLHPITRNVLSQEILDEVESRGKITVSYYLLYQKVATFVTTFNKYVDTVFDLMNSPCTKLLTDVPYMAINRVSPYSYDLEATIDTIWNVGVLSVYYKKPLEYPPDIFRRCDMFYPKLLKSSFAKSKTGSAEHSCVIPARYYSDPPAVTKTGVNDLEDVKIALLDQSDLVAFAKTVKNFRITYDEYLNIENTVVIPDYRIYHILSSLVVDKWNFRARGCEGYHVKSRYSQPNFTIYITGVDILNI